MTTSLSNIKVTDSTNNMVIKADDITINDESLVTKVNNKQDTLVSGTNIKTINNQSIVGSGNVSINIPTVNNATLTITQGGTNKGTFTANASSDVTIDLDSGGSVDIDNKSITENSSNQLQTVGVINSRDNLTAIKTWTGTKAQYDAITTKDSATLYNITDDTGVSLTILEALYPVGSVYITTANTCPLSTLISGSTWELVSSGRVLQGADSGHSAGTTIEAGLPNITGDCRDEWGQHAEGNGAFTIGTTSNRNTHASSENKPAADTMYFDASLSNSIYGNSTTVQPPAYVVNIYRRTA